jgi:hypothetical protein
MDDLDAAAGAVVSKDTTRFDDFRVRERKVVHVVGHEPVGSTGDCRLENMAIFFIPQQ